MSYLYKFSYAYASGSSIHAGLISSKLFHAIQMVETGGDPNPENAIGDGGEAIGPYQIHELYWQDAKSSDPSLVANGETYKNCMGTGSFNYSERVMQVCSLFEDLSRLVGTIDSGY